MQPLTDETNAPPNGARLAVLCLSASLGGRELNSLKFAGWMQERGWAVTFFAPPATPLARLAARWGVPLAPIRPPRALALPLTALRLRQQLTQHRTQVLVVTQREDLALAALVKRLLGGRLRILYQQHTPLSRPRRNCLHTWVYQSIDAWLTPLPGLARQVRAFTRFEPKRLHVVPLGVPLEQFWPAPHGKEAARRELHLPTGRPLLGILGRLDEGHGQAFAVEVLHRLRAGFSVGAELLIMGALPGHEDGAYLQQLRQLVARLGLQEQVHFRDFQENPAVFLHAIDAFVQAGAAETYRMGTLEAMTAGVPVVAAAGGGTRAIVQDGRTGLLYPVGNVEACVWGVCQCLSMPEATAELTRQAQQEAWNYGHHLQCILTEQVVFGFGLAAPLAC